jgi:hypothetical protein
LTPLFHFRQLKTHMLQSLCDEMPEMMSYMVRNRVGLSTHGRFSGETFFFSESRYITTFSYDFEPPGAGP